MGDDGAREERLRESKGGEIEREKEQSKGHVYQGSSPSNPS